MMNQNNPLYENIINSGKKPEVVAFDFFDTLVHRNCHPEVILYKWAQKTADLNDNIFSPEYIYALRKEKEVSGKKICNKEEITYKELCKLIFDEISSKYTLKYDENEFLSVSYKTECSLELKAITFDEECLDCVKRLSREIKTVIISDFYMGRDFFEKVLEEAGLGDLFDEIFISSDSSFRKSSGKLYDYAVSRLNIDCKDLCMVGDNRESDYEIPFKKGIQAIHRPYYVNQKHYRTAKETDSACRKLLYSKRNIYLGYIPELYFFVSELFDRLNKDGVKKAYFLSREGQLIKTLFEKYQRNVFGEARIESEYMFVSRKATLLPALKETDKENFDIIFRQYCGLPCETFLKNIGMTDDIIKRVLEECQISEDEIVESADSEVLRKIKSNDFFREKYSQLTKEQRELFLRYLNDIGIQDSDELAIVDVGWKGTIQDNLCEILPDKRIKGYYLGISSKEILHGDSKFGLLFDIRYNSQGLYDILSRGYHFYEYILLADHSSVEKYGVREGGTVVPILKEGSEDTEGYNYSKKLIDEFLEVFDEYSDIYDCSLINPPNRREIIKSTLLRQCVLMPREWKQKKEISEKIYDNFGILKMNPNEENKSVKELKKDYLFADYAFRLLDTIHLGKLGFIARAYCKLVYRIKLNRAERIV